MYSPTTAEWKIKAEAAPNFLPEEEHQLLGKESKEEHGSEKFRIQHACFQYINRYSYKSEISFFRLQKLG